MKFVIVNEKEKFALVPRPSSALEKVEPSKKRILSSIVGDTLALVRARDKSSAGNWNWEAFRCQAGLGVPKDFAKAAAWYRIGAEKGVAFAQRRLGLLYLNGDGVPQDYVEAIMWLRKAAAEPGDAEAQNALGDCYFHGRGVTSDFFEAVKWYRKAADQEHAQSHENLGVCSLVERGPSVEAFKWFLKAAEQGLHTAQHSTGRFYELGEVIPQDRIEAYKFYKLASEKKNEKAAENLQAIIKRMTEAEIAEGDRRYRKSRQDIRERRDEKMFESTADPARAREFVEALTVAIENRKKSSKPGQK